MDATSLTWGDIAIYFKIDICSFWVLLFVIFFFASSLIFLKQKLSSLPLVAQYNNLKKFWNTLEQNLDFVIYFGHCDKIQKLKHARDLGLLFA